MLAKRLIACLDVRDGRVVKGVNFVDLKDAGDPVEQARAYDAAGADKVAVNSAAVARPEVVSEIAERFGSQCVVASVDARWVHDHWEIFTHGGRIDRHLVGAREQQRPRILDRAYPAADGQRHEAHLRRAADHLEQRPAPFVARRDVEEA